MNLLLSQVTQKLPFINTGYSYGGFFQYGLLSTLVEKNKQNTLSQVM